ncbi:zinc ribbon domain-containing protein [Brevibacillus ruminantium]|uniref:Zinc ribbon domain-containing protein n=1 Tax=Brevibacillus ruminantium TaxID=2950604 RepID=A0ABY4WFZ8_9BACL|nr:FmdB family zinc ribbon protein [Brevibacillus ruminantium]USG65958.1 zinc ribbon domain-containing protein [Brevibacillus ruminantium]
MPTYQFTCETCGVFDLYRSMAHAGDLSHCPECQKPAVRVYSPVGLITSSKALRTRVEQSSVPKVVKKETSGATGEGRAAQPSHGDACRSHSHSHAGRASSRPHAPHRPWQVGH